MALNSLYHPIGLLFHDLFHMNLYDQNYEVECRSERDPQWVVDDIAWMLICPVRDYYWIYSILTENVDDFVMRMSYSNVSGCATQRAGYLFLSAVLGHIEYRIDADRQTDNSYLFINIMC